jgi:hypothetical protein
VVKIETPGSPGIGKSVFYAHKDPEQIYVRQDGADFYIFSDPEGKVLIRTGSAPFKVPDFDMDAAKRARSWFEENGYFKVGNPAIFLDS